MAAVCLQEFLFSCQSCVCSLFLESVWLSPGSFYCFKNHGSFVLFSKTKSSGAINN